MIQQAIQNPALITYLKGLSNYTWLHYCDGRKLLVAKSLGYFEERLPGFFRVHKTAMVNPHYITDLKAPPGHKMAGSITLKDEVTLPVSRRRWSEIIDPLTAAMLQSQTSFQLERNVTLPDQNLAIPDPVVPPVLQKGSILRHLWIVMADEMKGGLVRQLIGEKWPQWHLQVFETGSKLQKALPGATEMPVLIILDGSEAKSILTLQAIKQNAHFRFIPTLLMSSAGNDDVATLGYLSGANSVIVHPGDLNRYLQVLEKTFRYWLTMASAPYATVRSRPSLR